jgi:hypothetical protein
MRAINRPTENVTSTMGQISPAATVTLLSAGFTPAKERTAMEDRMAKTTQDQCGSCGAEIDESRRVDFTLKNGTRVCDSCFVKGTASPVHADKEWS